jgi:protein ImuA
MVISRSDIVRNLQKEILLLGGFKSPGVKFSKINLGPINYSFPNNCFPLGAMHEFLCENAEDSSATKGFISGVVSGLMNNAGVCVWISSSNTVFPPALYNFGIEAEKIIFINVKNEKESLWVMEEALKCDGLVAVISEMQELSFTVSRRFQLAVEQTNVTGFIIRNHPRKLNINACVARWKISPLTSVTEDDLPGLGFPRWKIDLFKIRNGKPGSWQMEWSSGKFNAIPNFVEKTQELLTRKTG